MRSSPMTRALSGRSLRLMLGLLALTEAHFMADSLATLVEIVVGTGGSVLDIALLLLLTSPQVIDFALPLILLIGLFFAIGGARDDNELVACAAAGVPWRHIPGYALRVGLLGALISLLFAGYLTPMANYAKRLAIHGIETRAVLEQINNPAPSNTIRRVKNRTVIATPGDAPGEGRGNLFIFEPDTGFGWRVSQARDWKVEGPDDSAAYSIRLNSFRDYREVKQDGNAAGDPQAGLFDDFGAARINVQTLAFDFRLDEVVRRLDRTRRSGERLLFTAAALSGAQADRPALDRRAGEIAARAILCVFAALAAVAASGFAATRGGRFAALPVAAVVVLGADVMARAFLGDMAAGGAAAVFWGASAAVTLCAVVLPLCVVAVWREKMIAPGRGRA